MIGKILYIIFFILAMFILFMLADYVGKSLLDIEQEIDEDE